MKIELNTPCTVPQTEMQQIPQGNFCNQCQKAVIDYSNMTDAEMLAYINKHGLGCGSFSEDQLNRELVPLTKRKDNRLFYLPLLASLFFKPAQSKAQSVPDTVQMEMKKDSAIMEKFKFNQNGDVYLDTTPVKGGNKIFGTGNISTICKYKTYGFYWRGYRITLFKVRVK